MPFPPARLSARLPAIATGPALALALTFSPPLQAATQGTACAIEWQVRLTTVNLPDAARGGGRAVPALDLVLGFDAGARTSTRLRLPAGWGALREANPDAPRLQPVPGDGQLRQVQHGAQARVMLQWQLLPTGEGTDTPGLRLAPGWSAFTGAAVLPWPDEAGTQPQSACLRVEAAEPVRWISNFGRAEGSSARWTWPAATADQVQQALYAGGALQWRDADAAGQTVTAVVPAGAGLGFDATALAERTARLQAALRRDWRDDERNPITVLALPGGQAGAQAGGLALNRALALQAPPDLALPGAASDELIAGLLLRRWMPERFGPLAHTDRGDGPLRAWFTEGFADYLAHRLLLREGLWTPEDYAAALNRKIDRYLAQPARSTDNLSLATGRAGAQALAELPAARGEWLALHWNNALRAAGRPGLEAKLQALMLPAAQARREGPLSAPLATHRLIAALRRDLGDVPLRELAHHIEEGAPFNLADGALGPCFQGRADAQGGQFRPAPQAGTQAACQGWVQGLPGQNLAAAAGSAQALPAQPAQAAGPAEQDDCIRSARPAKGARAHGKAAKGAKAAKAAKATKTAQCAKGSQNAKGTKGTQAEKGTRAGKAGKTGKAGAKSGKAGKAAHGAAAKAGGKAARSGSAASAAKKVKARH